MGTRLEDMPCENPTCAHPLSEHAPTGFCFGVRRHRTGYFIDCVCKKFKVPRSDSPQVPPRMV